MRRWVVGAVIRSDSTESFEASHMVDFGVVGRAVLKFWYEV